jgi:hypothetical protein
VSFLSALFKNGKPGGILHRQGGGGPRRTPESAEKSYLKRGSNPPSRGKRVHGRSRRVLILTPSPLQADPPLLLIGFGLGGLLIKPALVKACNAATTTTPPATQCIVGIVIFGKHHPEAPRCADDFLARLPLPPRSTCIQGSGSDGLSTDSVTVGITSCGTTNQQVPSLDLIPLYGLRLHEARNCSGVRRDLSVVMLS